MAFSYTRLQKMSDKQIRKFGARCVLRRAVGGDRECFAAVMTVDPEEFKGDVKLPVKRYALVSPLGLDPPPNAELDSLVTFIPRTNPPVEWERLRFSRHAGRLAPAGDVVYYELWIDG